MSNAHGYDTKQFPLTPAQGRVLYHVERIFRSTGGNPIHHHAYIMACAQAELKLRRVVDWTQAECVTALQILERVARRCKLNRFRDVNTGWQDFA